MKNILISITSFIILLGLQVVFSIIGYQFFPDVNTSLFVVSISIIFSFLVVIIGLSYFYKISLIANIFKPRKMNLILGFLIVSLLILVQPFFYIDLLNNINENKILIMYFNVSNITSYNYSISNIFYLAKVILIFPILEEFYYRFLIQNTIKKNTNAFIAILISSILFAIGHMDLKMLIPAFCTGLLLGYIYFKTNNIIISILIHMVFNAQITFSEKLFIEVGGFKNLYFLIYPLVIIVIIYLVSKLKDSQQASLVKENQ